MNRRLMAAALACARRGWPVFPLVPGGKRPAIKNWEHRATTDTARIERCWGAGAWNIGLACGPAALVVVDLDRPKGSQQRYNADGSLYTGAVGYDQTATEAGGETGFGSTFTVATPSGGWHLYFLFDARLINLAPEENQKTLTGPDRAAALWLGGEHKHLISK